MKILSEWWGQIWPNLAASGLTFGGGWILAKRRLLAEWEKRELAHLTGHQETQNLIKDLANSLDRRAGPQGKAD